MIAIFIIENTELYRQVKIVLFNYTLGIKEENEKTKTNYRKAVRAVILKDDNILLVHTNKGDFKFPGGGMNKEESQEQTLIREVKEETGYIVGDVKEKIGVFIERSLDRYRKDFVFEMISTYYLCELTDGIADQELDEYEIELGFKPIWINLNEAIHVNEEIIKNNRLDINKWIYRETKALKAVSENYDSLIKGK